MIVGKTFHFDAAHRLPNYSGKCRYMHGHTWKVTVELEGEIDKETHMIIDFNEVKVVMEGIFHPFDHQILNDVIPYPTCERVVEHIFARLKDYFSFAIEIKVHSVQVQEGEGGYARKERD